MYSNLNAHAWHVVTGSLYLVATPWRFSLRGQNASDEHGADSDSACALSRGERKHS